MRLQRAEDGLRWFMINEKNKIARVFYSKEKANAYFKWYTDNKIVT